IVRIFIIFGGAIDAHVFAPREYALSAKRQQQAIFFLRHFHALGGESTPGFIFTVGSALRIGFACRGVQAGTTRRWRVVKTQPQRYRPMRASGERALYILLG